MNALAHGAKMPYRRAAKTPYSVRLAARLTPQPKCKCGCGQSVAWNPRKGRWRAYMPGHYRRLALYKDEAWLRDRYELWNLTTTEIAAEAGVRDTTILHWMNRFGIPSRNRSESRIGRKIGSQNPSWRGGIADWHYSSNWKTIARRIRDRDGWTCQLCGECRTKWGKLLHVHHIDGNKFNNDPLNLISVCATCHPRGKKEREMAPLLAARCRLLEGGDANARSVA